MTFTSDFLDFYVLETIRHFATTSKALEFSHANDKLLEDVTEELESLTHNMYLALHDYIFMASFGEARHAYEAIDARLDCLSKDYSREYTYNLAKNYTPKDNYKVLSDLFAMNGWHGAVGGKMWRHIIDALDLIYVNHVAEGAFVDYCADLRHNCGLMFNKPIVLHDDMDTDMMMYILTEKRDAEDFAYDVYLGQYGNKNAYSRYYLHSKTASLLNRYMVIHHHKITDVRGSKPNEGYTPIEFGNQVLTIIDNDHVLVCDNCGATIESGKEFNDNDQTLCYSCHNDLYPDVKHYCDRCGKERTSQNQYIINELSLCHACYDIVKSQIDAIPCTVDSINKLSTSIKNAVIGTGDFNDVLKHLIKVDGEDPSP